ncbi:MAG: hypothetical protein KF801_06385 [Cryobacterium sp.]|jgi:hypothetical protein|nr:hypothetical protein [Cryobacterium sp.]
MSLTAWSLKAHVEWVTGSQDESWNWEIFPTMKASIAFADVDRHELFSTSGTATSKIRHSDAKDSELYVVDVLLPDHLQRYVKRGTQFLVLRGSICMGIGNIRYPGGPTDDN